MVHLELTTISSVATFLTSEVIPYFDLELSFRHIVGFFLSGACPYSVCVQMLCWASFPLWVVHCNGLLFPDIRVFESLFTFLRVSLTLQLFPGGEPLIRFEGHTPFLYRSCPSCSVMDDLRFGCDECVFPCPFVLPHQPLEVSEPYVPCDVLYIL